MLNSGQIADLDGALRDINDKKIILNTAIDMQALLRILVEKGIISREEINAFRKEVRESSKYNAALLYIEQTEVEIKAYQNDPQLRLRAMMKQKMEGK